MKTLVKFGLLVFGLLAIIILVIGASLNAIIKTGVETMGPQILGTSVLLEDVDISLLAGGDILEGNMTGLVIKNPEGFHTNHALSLPNIRIQIDRDSILSDTVIINEIIIDQPEITLEGSLKGPSNLETIQQRVKDFSRQSSSQESEPEVNDASSREGKLVLIRNVFVRKGQIHLSLTALQGQSLDLTLPDIQLKNIGQESAGTSFQDASAQIFEAIYTGVLKVIPGSAKLLGHGMEQLENSVKDLGETVEKVGKDLLKGLFD